MKVSIGDDLFIHIRVHRREDEDAYDFYSLHEVIKHNQATCVFKEGIYIYNGTANIPQLSLFFSADPLTYFNY
jgi:hypothetical protein